MLLFKPGVTGHPRGVRGAAQSGWDRGHAAAVSGEAEEGYLCGYAGAGQQHKAGSSVLLKEAEKRCSGGRWVLCGRARGDPPGAGAGAPTLVSGQANNRPWAD